MRRAQQAVAERCLKVLQQQPSVQQRCFSELVREVMEHQNLPTQAQITQLKTIGET